MLKTRKLVKREHRWSSENSNDYLVIAKRRKRETLLKIAVLELKITMTDIQ